MLEDEDLRRPPVPAARSPLAPQIYQIKQTLSKVGQLFLQGGEDLQRAAANGDLVGLSLAVEAAIQNVAAIEKTLIPESRQLDTSGTPLLRYPVPMLVAAVRLSSLMRDSAQMRQTLEQAAVLLCDKTQADMLIKQLRTNREHGHRQPRLCHVGAWLWMVASCS